MKLTKIKSNKKGQFYIFIAVVIIAFLVAVFVAVNRSNARTDTYSSLHQNFMNEASFVVNNDSSFSQLDNFTLAYLDFSDNVDRNFGLVYVYKNDDQIKIFNNIGENVDVDAAGSTFSVNNAAESTISAVDYVNIALEGNDYNFSISKNTLDLHVLSRSRINEAVRIYAE